MPKIFCKSLTLLFFMILISCKQKEQRVPVIKQEKTEKKHVIKPAVLLGKTDDPQDFECFNFIDDSYLFGTNHKDIQKEIIADTMILNLNAVNQPQLMEIMAFGKKIFYRTKFKIGIRRR